MASLFKRRKKWYIDYYDPTGKRIRTAVSPYRETALRALQKIEIEMAEGKYLDVRKNEPVLFQDFAKRYLDAHIRLENKSVEDQNYLLEGLIKYFQGVHLHKITPFAVRQFMSERLKTVKPATVNKNITMLKSMMNRAIEWGVLNQPNPLKVIKKLPENNERCRWLTEEEQERLLFHCHGVVRVIVLVALKTGMRWGEIVNLKWQQSPKSNYVDFDNNTIVIHESLSKSQKSRYVPLAPSIKEALMDFPQHSASGYIFINPKTGKPFDCIKRSLKTALGKAGIENFHFHDLRHCFASQLVRNGTDLYVVQKLLGHATPKMTQRYAHLRDDRLREAVDGLDKQNAFIEGLNGCFSPNLVTKVGSEIKA